jgi:hypothetical protein
MAHLIPWIIDMFAPILSVIEAGLLKDGVWVSEENDDDDEGTEDEESRTEMSVYALPLIFAHAFVNRHKHFDCKLLNRTAYHRLIKLKTNFKGILHLMAQDETDTRLFSDMVSRSIDSSSSVYC